MGPDAYVASTETEPPPPPPPPVLSNAAPVIASATATGLATEWADKSAAETANTQHTASGSIAYTDANAAGSAHRILHSEGIGLSRSVFAQHGGNRFGRHRGLVVLGVRQRDGLLEGGGDKDLSSTMSRSMTVTAARSSRRSPSRLPAPATSAPSSITGTSADETLRGTAGSDTIYGLDGKDKLYGEAGSDTINGGSGMDYLYGGLGEDVLTGGAGRDAFVFNTGWMAASIASTDFSPATTRSASRTRCFQRSSAPPEVSRSSTFRSGSAAHDRPIASSTIPRGCSEL